MDLETKETKRQIDVELKHLENVADKAIEISSDLEIKLKRIMMPINEGTDDEDTSEYKEVCDIAHSIRVLKDKILNSNERFYNIINRIEL